MATPEHLTDQTTLTRPTPEQATEAQAYFARPEILGIARNAIRHELGEKGVRHFETILAVAEPPTDDDVAHVCALAHQSMGGGGDLSALQKAHAKALKNPSGNFYASFVRYALRYFLGPVKP